MAFGFLKQITISVNLFLPFSSDKENKEMMTVSPRRMKQMHFKYSLGGGGEWKKKKKDKIVCQWVNF